ncbi:MAG TPA: Smr/MutS family protein [Thermodesulfobacteriota bacterium]|nr:Smr/MutS family protein [Thermodesulfobacteriota bacterium]
MEERSLRVLEFHLFLQGLQTYASSEVGQALCMELRPVSRHGEVQRRLQEVSEAQDLLEMDGDIPLEGLGELRPILHQARAEGTCLPPQSLLRVQGTAVAAGRVRGFLQKSERPHPRLKEWEEKVPELRDLHEALRSAIGPRGEILDSASPELRRLRREVSLLRARIRRALENLWEREDLHKVFQEQIITLRNERYVVAVKAEFKNTLPGIIHDQSQSRATFFIEPLSTLEENNELNMLLQDEKEEERRILLFLTDRVREKSKEISRAVEVLGHLDLVFAQAKWARAFRGIIPALNDRGCWRLRGARHPLLGSKAVPIDIHLEPGQSTLILTGANAGGKTAALKTLGLLTLIAQSGVPIPADEGSEVAVFDKVFADIGDEQDLRENLSTFSAWVRSVAHILQQADESSLVLLDEVGGGTDPMEGAALTMAILDGMHSRGVKVMVTTHLHLLKAYGAINPHVANVSVEFNPETLRPSYRLIYGLPGESHALLMAQKWGLPAEVVQKAYGYLGDGERKTSQLLQSLEQTQREMEKKLQEGEMIKREAEAFRRQSETLLRQTRQEEERLMAQVREESRAVVQHARAELRLLINEFKAKGRTDLHRLGQEIQAVEERISGWARKKGEEVRPWERPETAPSSSDSPDATLDRLKEAFAQRSGKESLRPAKRGRIDYPIPPGKREVKVIGLRVEEAIPLVDKAIDEAFLCGLKELEVIHGAGTGRLRQAIREHLQDHPLVKAFLPGGPGRGGNGVTVADIGPAPSSRPAQRRSNKIGAEGG